MCWRNLSARSTALINVSLSRLKTFSPFAWVPILAVGIISAIFAYKNYSFQQSASRPEMIIVRAEMFDPYDTGTLSLGMQNVGTRTAYDYRLWPAPGSVDTRLS
jgi:hypothetical protein